MRFTFDWLFRRFTSPDHSPTLSSFHRLSLRRTHISVLCLRVRAQSYSSSVYWTLFSRQGFRQTNLHCVSIYRRLAVCVLGRCSHPSLLSPVSLAWLNSESWQVASYADAALVSSWCAVGLPTWSGASSKRQAARCSPHYCAAFAYVCGPHTPAWFSVG